LTKLNSRQRWRTKNEHMKYFLWLFPIFTAGMLYAQNRTGIGTTNPQQRLSIDSTLNIDQGNFNNGTSPSLRFGSQSGEGIGSRRGATGNQFGLDFYTNFVPRIQITQQGRVGIGTGDPQQMLSVAGDVVIDQFGANTGAGPSLRLGFSSGEGIGSKRTPGGNQFGLDFFTGSTSRMAISAAGNVYIGGIGIGSERLNVNGNILASRVLTTEVIIDRNNQNTGNFTINDPSLMFGGGNTGEGIFSKRTPGDRQYGIDFYTGGNRRLSLLPSGNVEVVNNLVVNGGKGIIRNTSATQLKKVSSVITISESFSSKQTKQFAIVWPETLNGSVEAWVADIVPVTGNGGWAEVLMTVYAADNNGCFLYVHNTQSATVSPKFSVRIVAVGGQ
jgi:hypothetical protein